MEIQVLESDKLWRGLALAEALRGSDERGKSRVE